MANHPLKDRARDVERAMTSRDGRDGTVDGLAEEVGVADDEKGKEVDGG